MRTSANFRTVSLLLALAVGVAAFAVRGNAQGIPIGFEESYALAPDRAKVVADLIPGTEDWYYYHCRERLDARDFEAVRQVLPTWIKRHGRTVRVVEIENREALLAYESNPERAYDLVRRRLGLRFDHQRAVTGARSDRPTRLPPELLSPTALTRRALKAHPGTVDGFTDRALPALASADLDDRTLHSLLRRLRRPDVPNLPALIVRDLARRESRGFGSLPIHKALRPAHLDECQRLRPDLLQNEHFVRTYLAGLQPDADVAWQHNRAARAAYMNRLWKFVQRLNPRFNSLKAHVLNHWLRHDLTLGGPNKERFLAYIRLPRRQYHAAKAHLDRHQRRAEFVRLDREYPTLMKPIGRDDGLVRRCLEHFFVTEDSIQPYASFLDAKWLERVLAETKILLGQGDMERWYSLLDDPGYLEQLEKRVELRFPDRLPRHYGADDAVRVELDTKNVPTLVVKVFEIDSYRYHVETQREVDASIELDGVVANFERTFNYPDAPSRRMRRTFDLPMLRKPGLYVVEFVGNGIASRAVIRKGELRMVERTTAAGHAVRIYDERGRHVPDATAWFGGREYQPDDEGDILVPFTTQPGNKQLVLHHGNRSALATFRHRAESYQLTSHVHVDREELLAGRTARLLVRPQLRLSNHPIPLQLLTDPVLTIVATDLEGLATTQEVRELELSNRGELVHEFRVPPNLLSLSVTLAGKVEGLDGKPVKLSSTGESLSVNGLDTTAETSQPLLMRTTGGYVVALRGKNGETQAGRVCRLRLHHRDYNEPVVVTLQTDQRGRIELGPLAGVERVDLQKDGKTGGSFLLREAACRVPSTLHGRVGSTLRVPYQGTSTAPTRTEFSLLDHRRDAFSHLAIADGFLELRNLLPGDYVLQLHETGQRVRVRITSGERDDAWLVGPDRSLTADSNRPLQVTDVAFADRDLTIRLAHPSESTRVHVVATRFLPTFDPFARLRGLPASSSTAIDFGSLASSYHAGRKLGDEYRYVLERRFAKKYPGNMLERPSLLLNPWELDLDSWNSAVGLGGGAGGKYGGRGGRAESRRASAVDSARIPEGANPGTLANLDYLPRGSQLLANLRPDANGLVRVPLADLGDGQHVHVLALDGSQAVYDTAVRAEKQLQPRSRALPQALAADGHFVEQKRIQFVAAGQSATLADARSAQVEIHDSLGSVYRLFQTISKDAGLHQFAFLVDWPQLPRAKKLELYDQHACHELHFFLYQKDREFFRAVVRPHLTNKLDKSFLDHWLLESDLRAWLEPWKFARLNVIEKILLARRLGDREREAVARSLRETLELNPLPPAVLAGLFSYALKGKQLQDEAGAPALSPAFNSDSRSPGGGGGGRGRRPSRKPRGQAGPTTGAVEKSQQFANDDKQGDVPAPVAAEALEQEEPAEAPSRDIAALREVAKRKSVRRLYREVARTRLLVEHNYWQRMPAESTADVVRANRFWVDYATAPEGKPFVSASLVEATGSFLEMIMALSVLDLPFEAGEHEVVADGDRRQLEAASPLLLVRKEVRPADPAAADEPLLLGENFFRLDDRYRWVNGQRRDAFVTGEFLVDVAYGCQVVVTNPTSAQRAANVLLQIPAGAVPLNKGFWTRGVPVQLAPYATVTLEYFFYFPTGGSFAHYPAHAADKGKLLAHAEARTMRVVDEPSTIDTSSWEHVSQQASPAEVLTFLDGHNVQRLNLGKVAWRMRDREFFGQLLAKLRSRHVYHDTLWSYGILHRDARTTREYLRHAEGFLAQCGAWLDSTLVSLDPKERGTYHHLELSPLVHQRTHRLGGQRVLGNRDLAKQYESLMRTLGYKPRLDSEDWLSVTYYFLLQGRTEEALASFGKVDPQRVPARVQLDYLSAYLAFFTGETDRARRIATTHADHPVARWRNRFREVLAHLDEADGKTRPASEEQTPANLAATAPALELAIEGKTIAIGHQNLTQCEVRYYELDIEFAFSSQPFAGPDGASAAFVRPNRAEVRPLAADGSQTTFELPRELWQKNVLVEVRAAGLVRSRQYFTNALDVRFLESYGQLAVREPTSGRPLAKTYVKVFARLGDGRVRFHKDGYTDLRGRFDYASLSDDPNRTAVRYAVLVLDEERGAITREINPPAK